MAKYPQYPQQTEHLTFPLGPILDLKADPLGTCVDSMRRMHRTKIMEEKKRGSLIKNNRLSHLKKIKCSETHTNLFIPQAERT